MYMLVGSRIIIKINCRFRRIQFTIDTHELKVLGNHELNKVFIDAIPWDALTGSSSIPLIYGRDNTCV